MLKIIRRLQSAHGAATTPVPSGESGELHTEFVCHWEGPLRHVGFRLDLVLPTAERVAAWRYDVAHSCSTVIDLSRTAVGSLLPGGLGVAKLVLDTAEVGSLRPYFQLSTPTSVT